jgi:type I restriction enzyme S subunit
MSRIDQLIAELCPDGVTFKELGDACLIKTGQAVNKIVIQNNPGDFPVINSGREPLGYINTFNVEDDPIGITSRGAGVGSITWCDGKYFRGNLNYSSTVRKNVKLVPRFLYHYLMGNQASIQQLATYDGIPALNASNLKKLRIPIPPLEIQREIVKVLDTFTQLEAELEAELEARRRQYQYYRDALLSFDERMSDASKQASKQARIRWATLGEIATYGNTRIPAAGLDAGSYVGVDNLLPDMRGKATSNYVPTSGTVIGYEFDDILIGNIRPYLKKIWVADSTGGTNQDVLVVRLKEDERNSIKPRYLYHLLASEQFFAYDMQYAKGAKMPRGDKAAIMQYEIPIPPIEEQARIVSILDKFDALVNDLSSGLPAEIQARRQQYEHYRDRLLSFKEAA